MCLVLNHLSYIHVAQPYPAVVGFLLVVIYKHVVLEIRISVHFLQLLLLFQLGLLTHCLHQHRLVFDGNLRHYAVLDILGELAHLLQGQALLLQDGLDHCHALRQLDGLL